MTATDILEQQAKLRVLYKKIEALRQEIKQLEKQADVLDELIVRLG
jgi:cell division protein FtsB